MIRAGFSDLNVSSEIRRLISERFGMVVSESRHSLFQITL
jgi:hypothetical protein